MAAALRVREEAIQGDVGVRGQDAGHGCERLRVEFGRAEAAAGEAVHLDGAPRALGLVHAHGETRVHGDVEALVVLPDHAFLRALGICLVSLLRAEGALHGGAHDLGLRLAGEGAEGGYDVGGVGRQVGTDDGVGRLCPSSLCNNFPQPVTFVFKVVAG